MFPVNCYVLWDETKEAVVIDPGCFYEEEKQALKKFILTNELNVKHLLNTHLHLDHIFGNPFMLKEFGLSAEANKADEYWIDEAPKQSRMFGFQLQEAPVPLGKYLHDGDIITFGHTQLEAIHVPGHSPGSLVYYCKEDNCMFSGDVLFQGSIGRADLTGGNFDELIEHICSRLFVLPNETVVYPGHGAPTTIGMEKQRTHFSDKTIKSPINMKTDLLASRHIGINEQDTAVMLRKIGVESLDELIDKTIPANIRLKEPLALASPLTEYEFGKHIAALASKTNCTPPISV